jgi:pyruvate kinase
LNLAHYLSLRRWDLRPLQMALMPWGLSSLGRLESRVIAHLDAELATLGVLANIEASHVPPRPPLRAFRLGDRLLRWNSRKVFGAAPGRRRVRIMVTLPTEAATDPGLVRDLLAKGTDCFRINCAHDTVSEWEQMIAHIRRAMKETGRPCKLNMELGGPKPRTREVFQEDAGRRLYPGDRLALTRAVGESGVMPAFRTGTSLPEVLDQLRVGERVWFDEGRFGGRIVEVDRQSVVIEVTHALPKGARLRPDKGLNFPDSHLTINPLTTEDLRNLEFVAAHADIVGCSFIREPADLDLLQNELDRRLDGRPPPALLVKIETAPAVRSLPELIIHAASRRPLTVMIARGDLAVEIGYQRLAEIQEEILWLCEAAHVPVVWATQVFDRLVRKGTPTRAEITDAAMSERAECVMLNKGPYVGQAVAMLEDVLTRMEEHQSKKTAHLRALKSWQYLVPPGAGAGP